MSKFRQKPKPVDAIQWTGDNYQEILKWIGYQSWRLAYSGTDCPNNRFIVTTPHGEIEINPGDFIVRSVETIYAREEELFLLTHEKIGKTWHQKEIEVEAIQWNIRNIQQIGSFVDGLASLEGVFEWNGQWYGPCLLHLNKLYWTEIVRFTDWIVAYDDWVFVVNNDLFERLYERVNEIG